jgi:hypothetical protein
MEHPRSIFLTTKGGKDNNRLLAEQHLAHALDVCQQYKQAELWKGIATAADFSAQW